MQQGGTRKRGKAEPRDSTKIKPKFQEQRVQEVQQNPLRPLNGKQRYYMELLNTKPVVIATGYAGTAKSYIPTVMAADKFKLGEINKILITRPAVSTSKSVGFFKGDNTEKMSIWLMPVVQILKERLGQAAYEIAVGRQDIEFVPLEVVKGLSVNNAWLICEESSDLTKEEVIKLVTRMGKNSKLVLAGDIRQSELKGQSGLSWLVDFVKRHDISENFGFVDFNETGDIVRSEAVKKFIIALVKDEKSNSEKGTQ